MVRIFNEGWGGFPKPYSDGSTTIGAVLAAHIKTFFYPDGTNTSDPNAHFHPFHDHVRINAPPPTIYLLSGNTYYYFYPRVIQGGMAIGDSKVPCSTRSCTLFTTVLGCPTPRQLPSP